MNTRFVMKHILEVAFLLFFSISCVIAQEKVTIFYETNEGKFQKIVDKNVNEIEIINSDTNDSNRKIITKITGLELVPNLEKLTVSYFQETDLLKIETKKPILLVIQNSKINDINQLLSLNIKGISVQSCLIPENVIISIVTTGIQYFEITNSGLQSLPLFSGKIPVVNYSYNNILQISEKDRLNYANCTRVILIGNKVTNGDTKFIVKGDLADYLSHEWYNPQ